MAVFLRERACLFACGTCILRYHGGPRGDVRYNLEKEIVILNSSKQPLRGNTEYPVATFLPFGFSWRVVGAIH